MGDTHVNVWTRIRSTIGLMWDLVVLSVSTVCKFQGYVGVSRSFFGGPIDVFFSPAGRHTKSEKKFLESVSRFGARAMDRIFRHEGVDCQVVVWADGKIPLQEGSGERVLKGVRLILDKTRLREAGIDSLSKLAATDQRIYLELCSFEWVDPSESPKRPVPSDP